MQKILQESTNPFESSISESYFIPLTEDSIKEYLASSSKNANKLKDQYDMQDAVTLGIDKKGLIYFQEGNTILAAYLEDYLSKELDRYLANF